MRALALALLLATTTAPVAAVADPLPGVPALEFTATGPATAAFTLDAPVAFDYDNAVVTGDGHYAGVVLYSAAGRWYGGVVSTPDLDSPARPMPLHRSSPMGGGAWRLPAGRYRVYVLTDGPADVRLPLDSGSSMTVAASAPDRQSYAATGTDLPAGATSTALARTVTVRARTRTIVLGQFDRGVALADVELRACLARLHRTCTGVDRVAVHSGGTVGSALRAGLAEPAWRERAPRDGRVEVTTPSSYGAHLALVVVQFDLV
jgi:hypothetical protein